MATNVEITDDEVSVEFTGWDRVWAFRKLARLPLSTITGARVAPVSELRDELGWKLGGTGLPGVCIAGSFSWRPSRPGHRQLWSTYRDPDALVIDTVMPVWSRVVLQHPDRDELAAEINRLTRTDRST